MIEILKETPEGRRFVRLLLFARELEWNDGEIRDGHGLYPVHRFIRALTDVIVSNRATSLDKLPGLHRNNGVWERFFSKDIKFYKLISGERIEDNALSIGFDVHTDAAPVLPKTWMNDKLKSLTLLPIGVTFIPCESHFAEDKITVAQNPEHRVIDISPLYKKMFFNGKDYIARETGEIIGKAESFEMGCVYEIGRMLFENGVDFLGYLCSGAKVERNYRFVQGWKHFLTEN